MPLIGRYSDKKLCPIHKIKLDYHNEHIITMHIDAALMYLLQHVITIS